MRINPIKTRVLHPPQDDLLSAIKESISEIEENSILVVTSKVVSIHEGRCLSQEEFPDRDAIVKEEADKYLPRDFVPNEWMMHSIKNNTFIASAGIDKSNADNYWILWPEDPRASAEALYHFIRKIYGIKNCGIIITDSHVIPLRRGLMGISLAHYGFVPLRDYRGKADLFGNELVVAQTNIVDGLAAAAVVITGEGNESMPLALISDIDFVKFTDKPPKSDDPFSSLEIPEEEDLFYPFLSSVPWKKGGGGKKT